jgi:uncharacterized protein (TIGR02271 family)
MPIMDVRYATGSLDNATKADLARRLTDVLIQMEGDANTPGGRAFACVCFTEFARDDLWIAGRCGGDAFPAAFLVHISVPIAAASISARLPRENGSEHVVPVGEERLNVATRTVPGETTRIRRRVVEQPVEQQVTLREEKVVVERRPSTGKPGDTNLFTETVAEMSDSREVPTVWKSLHVSEEVVLRKQVTERTEKVRGTVRRDVVEVDHARKDVAAPTEFGAKGAAFQEKAAETREQLVPGLRTRSMAWVFRGRRVREVDLGEATQIPPLTNPLQGFG